MCAGRTTISQAALIALITAVIGTIGYHLAQQQIASDASPALVLALAYLVGAAICSVLLVVSVTQILGWHAQ